MSEVYTPKVSVIIPVYNVEPYLRECLDSVVNQTLRDIEIICLDDGSTDGSPAILEEYREKDERITVITQENRGLSAARNRGLEVACGEYICFIDSDDYVELNLLEKTVPLADEMGLDALVFGNYNFHDSKTDPAMEASPDNSVEILPIVQNGVQYMKWSKNCGAYPVVVWRVLWSRSFLCENTLRFKEGMIHEDNLFSFQAFFAARRVLQISDRPYYHRLRTNSIMSRPKTHENVIGCFLYAEAALAYGLKGSHTPEEEHEIWRAYTAATKKTTRCYRALSREEKSKVTFPTKLENELFRQIILSNSISDREYRAMRTITFLPRKLRGGILCLKEHGPRYTAYRLLEHLTGKAN